MKTKDINKICSSLVARAKTHKRMPVHKKASKVMGHTTVRPNTKSPWLSVEIECYFKQNWDDCYVVLSNAFAAVGLENFVRIKDDGSIDPEYNDYSNSVGVEVVISAPESKILSVLEKTCCILNSLGAKTNSSCGLHIHIDHRPIIKRNALLSYNNLFYAEDLLFKVSKPYRRKSEFCEPLNSSRNKDIDPLSAFIFDGYDERYKSINIQAMGCHQTIEVRAFHATTNFDEIKHFVGLVLGVINSKTILSKRINAKSLDSFKSIPLSTRKFIKAKFSHKRKAA